MTRKQMIETLQTAHPTATGSVVLHPGMRVRVDAPGDPGDLMTATIEAIESDGGWYHLKFDDGDVGSYHAREIEAV